MLKAKNDLQAGTKRYSQADGPVRRPTVKGKKLHILVPDVVQDDVAVRSAAEKLTHNSEKEDYIQELRTLAEELEFVPDIHLMRLTGIEAEIDQIPIDDLIMNVCDGCDIDGVPGPSVAAYLEKKNFPNVVGCDSIFINNTLTKNGMKELFRESLVSTPPGIAVTKDTDLAKEIEAWGMVYPLFVKVSDSYGSVGLDDSSVCHDLEQVQNKCKELLEDFENLTLEEYIDGQEYSVLVSGNCRDENSSVIVYPPAERAFNKDLPRFKRFISYVRNWDEAQYAHDYAKVDDPNDYAALQDLARRSYAAVAGNCYGRVDVRKRDVSGKFYVLEVNASCGLGKGSSSEFILKLAGQTTQDFFQILLSSALKPALLESVTSAGGSYADLMTAEPDALSGQDAAEAEDELAPLSQVLPPEVEQKVAKLIRNPSLAVVPNPIVHVVISAVLVDPDSGIPDPEGKLAVSYGKDAEYVSELESIFRTLNYDPIVHLYHVDDVEVTLRTLNREEDLICNACLGDDGLEVAKIVEDIGFAHTVGLNARFYTESRDRQAMREGLVKNRLSVPNHVVFNRNSTVTEITDAMYEKGFQFPVYVKPTIRKHVRHNSGQKVQNEEELKEVLEQLPEGETWLVEEYILGQEYLLLVAGDARDPFADVIVFPPVQRRDTLITPASITGKDTSNPNSGILGGVVRKLSMMNLGKSKQVIGSTTRGSDEHYTPMNHPDDLIQQMDLQDLARRAFVAVHGSCYGLVAIVDRNDGAGLTVIGVSGDVRFGDEKSGTILRLAGLSTEALFSWLLKRPVKA
ncbi:hypothetical protein DFS34DRAFT_592328 [Phlyctochytrium arcticum]|nr:hypothetical protein DFS34DRAFT_592328 [Phlyctochytrium arcticum]